MKKGELTETGERSRRRILDATIELLGERGLTGTSMNAVCERAGVAKTGVYWHFDNKAGLLAAAIEDLTAAWIEEFSAAALVDGSPGVRRRLMLEAFTELLERRPERFRVLLVAVMERRTVDPRIRDAVRRATDATIDAIATGVGRTLGVDLPDPDLFGHTVLALLEAALRRRIMDPNCDLSRLVEDIGRMVDLMVQDRLARLPS